MRYRRWLTRKQVPLPMKHGARDTQDGIGFVLQQFAAMTGVTQADLDGAADRLDPDNGDRAYFREYVLDLPRWYSATPEDKD